MPFFSLSRDSRLRTAAALLLLVSLGACVALPSGEQKPDAAPASTASDGVATAAGTGVDAARPASREPPEQAPEARTAAPAIADGPLPPRALPGWRADDLAGMRDALTRQCARPRPPAPWPALCRELPATDPALATWIDARFLARPLTGADGDPVGLITGYHEPERRGSRTRESATQVPLYQRPSAQVLGERPSRTRIESTGLLRGSELVWLDDPVEAFFLQVQGSGRVRLRDGSVLRVGYAGNNGLPYRAIGAVLVARGAMPVEDVNAGSIKAWLRANPGEATAVMRANPRYIFFRALPPAPSDVGPPGSLGVPLTPMRSVAVDPAKVPPGALLWLDSTDPIDGVPLRRLVVAQDTGAAIVGPVRADLFWGAGERAELGAGLMKQPGRLWLLTPRD